MNGFQITPGGAEIVLQPSNILFLLLKVGFLAGFLLYIVFSFMIVRQVQLMEETFKTALGPFLKVFAIAHFLVAVAVFVLAIITL